MREQEHIPKKYTDERPSVLPDAEAFKLSVAFAAKYGELKKGFTPKSDFESVGALVENADEHTAAHIKKILPELLREAGYDALAEKNMVAAVQERDYSGLQGEEKENDLITALSLVIPVERAQSALVAESLEKLEGETLKRFGMTPDGRDVVASLIRGITSANPEFIRFKARALKGEAYPKRPTDALRESLRIMNHLNEVARDIETRGARSVFGESGEDFVAYLKILADSYRPMTAGGEPYTVTWHRQQEKKVEEAFNNFLGKYPDHPLIVVPVSWNYVKTKEDINLGYDPELRVLWQSPRDRQSSLEVTRTREIFTNLMYRHFEEYVSNEDMKYWNGVRPIVCEDIVSSGLNMAYRAEAFEAGDTFLLIRNFEERVLTEPVRKALREKCGEEYQKIIDDPVFIEFTEHYLVNHELGHKVLKKADTAIRKCLGRRAHVGLEEYKADILSAATLRDTLYARAEEKFPGKGQEVVTMVTIGVALSYKELSPDGETGPYRKSAEIFFKRMREEGLIGESEDGNLKIDTTLLQKDLTQHFISFAREVLELYRLMETGTSLERERATQRAKELLEG